MANEDTKLTELKQVVANSAGRIGDLVGELITKLTPEQSADFGKKAMFLTNEIAVLKALAPAD